MGCSKYTLINTGSTSVNFNYRRCEDSLWEYQIQLNPNETKNIWLIDDTFSIASSFIQQITLENQGVFPPENPPTPTPTPTITGSPVITPSSTPTLTPSSTPTLTPSSTSLVPPQNDLLSIIIPNDDLEYTLL